MAWCCACWRRLRAACGGPPQQQAAWRSPATPARDCTRCCSRAANACRLERHRTSMSPETYLRPVAVDGAFELGLVHLRPAVDVVLARFVVQLVVGPALGALVRAKPAAAAGRDVVRR